MTIDLDTASCADVEALLTSWTRSMRSQAKSPRTIESYTRCARQLTEWCAENDRPVLPVDQRRADIEDFITYSIQTLSTGTAGVRYRSLKQWFAWLVDEDEVDASPMDGMKHPKLDEPVVDVISQDQLRALLEATKGRTISDRRDHAMLRILIDTGMRRGELVALKLTDVDLDDGVIVIHKSKTKRGRIVPLGAKSAAALDRYIRKRATHRDAETNYLWLGLHGRMTGSGVSQMLTARCRQAGIGKLHVHQFRHTAAHLWLMAGGQEQDLARIAGWTPGSAMLSRYGASAASERARQAHRTFGPGDAL